MKLKKNFYLILLFTVFVFRISFAQNNLPEIHKKVEVLYKKAKFFDDKQKYDSSYVYYKKAAPLFEKLKDSVKAARCYINLGVDEYYYGNPDKALNYYNRAAKLLESSEEYSLSAKIFNNIALIKKSEGNYQDAVLYFHKSIDRKHNLKIIPVFNNLFLIRPIILLKV